MRSEGTGLSQLLLSPLSTLYRAGVSTRLLLYRAGLIKTEVLPCKVISIGNITVGGSGKTPMSIFIAERLRNAGRSVAVLSRGYKRTTTGVKVVSDKEQVYLTPKEAGDEPYLMALRLKGIPVVVGEKRYEAGKEIIERFAPDVILLDDGFQHIRLARDLNILLVDSAIGFGSGRLLPSGILREPISATERADLIMVKGGKLAPSDRARLTHMNKEEMEFRYVVKKMNLINKSKVDKKVTNQDARVLVLAALAEPGSFVSTVEDLGLDIATTRFYRDHHSYTEADLTEVLEAAEGLDAVVTTEKDAVKLHELFDKVRPAQEGPPVYALRIDVEVSDPERLDALLNSIPLPTGRSHGGAV